MNALFSSLPSRLQLQALETMALLWKEDPPRYDITLDAISAALIARQRVLDGVHAGRWDESGILELEALIEAAGGRLAPDLHCTGSPSLPALREQAFAPLRSLLSPPALQASQRAVGAALERLKPVDLLSCFALQEQLLSPLLHDSASAPWRDQLLAFETERQVAAFAAWADVLRTADDPAQPGLLTGVITAFAAEVAVRRAIASGAPLRPALAALESALQAVGCALSGLPTPATLAAVAQLDLETPGLRQQLESSLHQHPGLSLEDWFQELTSAPALSSSLAVNQPSSTEHRDTALSSELTVLQRYGVTADALRRRLVSNWVNSVSFPEHTMAAVIAELTDDLAIRSPIQNRLDQAWLDTLSDAERRALLESWEDLRLRHWIEANLTDQAKEVFSRCAPDFDRYVYECIQVSDVSLARHLHQLVISSSANFGDLAARYSEGPERWTRGVVGPVMTADMDPDLLGLLRGLQSGDITPPTCLAGSFHILRLLHHFPASLDQSLQQQILWDLFEQELDSQVEAHLRQIEAGDVAFPASIHGASLLLSAAAARRGAGALPSSPSSSCTPSSSSSPSSTPTS